MLQRCVDKRKANLQGSRGILASLMPILNPRQVIGFENKPVHLLDLNQRTLGCRPRGLTARPRWQAADS